MRVGKREPRKTLPASRREEFFASLGEALASVDSVRMAVVFGSVARGEPARDLDVGLVLDEPWSWPDLGPAAHALDRAARETGLEVDVVPLNGATPSFRHHVATEGHLVYERDAGTWMNFYARAIFEWSDLATSLRLAGHPVGGFHP